jgi:hypothetical protein
LIDFHGQPANPIPKGRTFTLVVHADVLQGGSTVEIFIPSDQTNVAKELHSYLVNYFWNGMQINNDPR